MLLRHVGTICSHVGFSHFRLISKIIEGGYVGVTGLICAPAGLAI